MTIELDPTLQQDGTPHAIYDWLEAELPGVVKHNPSGSRIGVQIHGYAAGGKHRRDHAYVTFVGDRGKVLTEPFPINLNNERDTPPEEQLARFLANVARAFWREIENREDTLK